MNKIQYIELLKLRGVTKLKNESINSAIRNSGGNATPLEMVKVNQRSMDYYIEKFEEQKKINQELCKENEKLEERSDWLSCLESAGVDNWEGYDYAVDLSEEQE